MALERCRTVAAEMASCAAGALRDALGLMDGFSPELAGRVRAAEEETDHYEDILGTYLVRLSTLPISEADSGEAAKLLKIIGDFERISDHAASIATSAEELRGKGLAFSGPARAELSALAGAVGEILDLTLSAFLSGDLERARQVEPLEQVIDGLKETLRTRHILRLQQNLCGIGAGFVLSDLLTDLERVADHCSNIAGCLIDMEAGNLNLHESLRAARREDPDYAARYAAFARKYAL